MWGRSLAARSAAPASTARFPAARLVSVLQARAVELVSSRLEPHISKGVDPVAHEIEALLPGDRARRAGLDAELGQTGSVAVQVLSCSAARFHLRDQLRNPIDRRQGAGAPVGEGRGTDDAKIVVKCSVESADGKDSSGCWRRSRPTRQRLKC